LEKEIHSTGFFQQKAKSIKNCCVMLLEKHNGVVPQTMEELTALPGVGRKTANVLLGNAFGIPGLAVDTHVRRISQLLGLTENDNPEKIEFDLMEVVPKKEWSLFSHLLMEHGRKTCVARKPKCAECCLADVCPSCNV
jgi:endonuclease-3